MIVLGVVGVGAARLGLPTPALHNGLRAPSVVTPVAGVPPPIPPPIGGSLAVDAGATADEELARENADTVRPIASVTKAMTALVVLQARPLPPTAEGPSLTASQADVDDYTSISASGGSTVPVRRGEVFSERQLLLALMLPSANNIALSLARWIDGGVPAFVARLNARAAALGMSHSHFVDPDGLDQRTTSTASDLLRLGRAVIGDTTLTAIVSTATATLPDGTAIANLDQLVLTEPGWIGVKTGWTPEAGGCLLFAARRTLGLAGAAVTVVGAVLDQPPDPRVDPAHPELGTALAVARRSVEAAFEGYAAVWLTPATLPLAGEVSSPWGERSTLTLTGPSLAVPLRLGRQVALSFTALAVAAPLPRASRVGGLTARLPGGRVLRWTVITTGAVPGPSIAWRLFSR